MDRNLPFFQEFERLARNVKALGHAAREHDNFRAMIQQFLDIDDLNTGTVRGVCLAPIPFTRAAWEKLCVFVWLGFAFDFQLSPRDVVNSRRTIGVVQCCCHSDPAVAGEEPLIKFRADPQQIDQRCFSRDCEINITPLGKDRALGDKSVAVATVLRAVYQVRTNSTVLTGHRPVTARFVKTLSVS